MNKKLVAFLIASAIVVLPNLSFADEVEPIDGEQQVTEQKQKKYMEIESSEFESIDNGDGTYKLVLRLELRGYEDDSKEGIAVNVTRPYTLSHDGVIVVTRNVFQKYMSIDVNDVENKFIKTIDRCEEQDYISYKVDCQCGVTYMKNLEPHQCVYRWSEHEYSKPWLLYDVKITEEPVGSATMYTFTMKLADGTQTMETKRVIYGAEKLTDTQKERMVYLLKDKLTQPGWLQNEIEVRFNAIICGDDSDYEDGKTNLVACDCGLVHVDSIPNHDCTYVPPTQEDEPKDEEEQQEVTCGCGYTYNPAKEEHVCSYVPPTEEDKEEEKEPTEDEPKDEEEKTIISYCTTCGQPKYSLPNGEIGDDCTCKKPSKDEQVDEDVDEEVKEDVDDVTCGCGITYNPGKEEHHCPYTEGEEVDESMLCEKCGYLACQCDNLAEEDKDEDVQDPVVDKEEDVVEDEVVDEEEPVVDEEVADDVVVEEEVADTEENKSESVESEKQQATNSNKVSAIDTKAMRSNSVNPQTGDVGLFATVGTMVTAIAGVLGIRRYK